MSALQRVILSVVPKRWADALERESRAWTMQCPCGHETSIWEAGGIRYKAAGRKHIYGRCPKCRRFIHHRLYKKPVEVI